MEVTMDFRDIVRLSLEECKRDLYKHVNDLTLEELTWQPSPEANPAGYLVWHIARDEDGWINRRIRRIPQIWVRDGWYQRFGLPEDASGYGFTAEQIANFPLPGDFSQVTNYFDSVRAETLEFLQTLDDSDLDREIMPEERPGYTVANAFSHLIVEESLHMGQVWYLRGLQRGLNR
jgi:uncharacterized damage-inducible protein DinB